MLTLKPGETGGKGRRIVGRKGEGGSNPSQNRRGRGRGNGWMNPLEEGNEYGELFLLMVQVKEAGEEGTTVGETTLKFGQIEASESERGVGRRGGRGKGESCRRRVRQRRGR